MKRTAALLLILSLVGSIAGCASMKQRDTGVIIGAAGGAVVGGLIGNKAGSTAVGAILGAVVGALTSLIAYPILLRLMGRSGEFKLNKKAIPWLIGGGIATSTSWIGMFTATQMGSVSVVSAIIGANPLFGLILSAILLRDTERITKQVAAGSILIVIAVIVITLF